MQNDRTDLHPRAVSLRVKGIPIVKFSVFSLAEGIGLAEFSNDLGAGNAFFYDIDVTPITRPIGCHED